MAELDPDLLASVREFIWNGMWVKGKTVALKFFPEDCDATTAYLDQLREDGLIELTTIRKQRMWQPLAERTAGAVIRVPWRNYADDQIHTLTDDEISEAYGIDVWQFRRRLGYFCVCRGTRPTATYESGVLQFRIPRAEKVPNAIGVTEKEIAAMAGKPYPFSHRSCGHRLEKRQNRKCRLAWLAANK
ncbi:hypothetical protein ABZ567_04140 [Streptomyces sp. NPDC016459]|uniref:hypothetical protein n=1 Tax=Streptomyces sp. NPDC016459 TaxID=3157190 RepID=UPI0033F7B4E9